MRRLLLALGTSCLLVAGCSEVAFVDEVTIVNDTTYSANVEVTDGERSGWLGLTKVGPETTRTIEDVIDQGNVWIFRFDYVGKYEEELEIELGGRRVLVPPIRRFQMKWPR